MNKKHMRWGILGGCAAILLVGCHSDPTMSAAETKTARQEFTQGGVDMNKVPADQKAKVAEMVKKYGGGTSRPK